VFEASASIPPARCRKETTATNWSSVACPSAGSCGGQFTANTMACVSEAIGLALPGSAGAPAPYESRDAFALAAASGDGTDRPGHPPARYRAPARRFENAAIVVAATGGSTNARCICRRWRMKRHRFRPVRRRRDLQAHALHRRPEAGRPYVAKDMFEAGGVPLLMKALLDGGFCMATA
jgi:dihydroxy-acid dehydratase